MLRFDIHHHCQSTHARTGRVTTPHGSFDTPAFMPVGTRASIKGLTPAQVRRTGSEIILNNAYHLMLRPGDDLIARRGGVHAFMRWGGPILTDSGGYQAHSMSDINSVDDDGVTFKSIIDGSMIRLTPERSMEVQNNLAADIIMAFDDCPPSIAPRTGARSGRRGPFSPGSATGAIGEGDHGAEGISGAGGSTPRDVENRPYEVDALHRARLRAAHERTVRWLQRCRAAHARTHEQALFGIIQGGPDLELRARAIESICSVDLPGYAIGGVAVGEGPELIHRVVEFTAPRMPPEKPRYLMGVGYEQDILTAVQAGVDMFDCVLPTRNGRNGQAFTRRGRLHLRNATCAEDDRPLEDDCDCETCAGGFSRAYLRHLLMSREMLGPSLLSLHNIRYFQRLMLDIRKAIRENGWSLLLGAWPVLQKLPPSDDEPARACPTAIHRQDHDLRPPGSAAGGSKP